MNQLALPRLCPLSCAAPAAARTEVVEAVDRLPHAWDELTAGAHRIFQRPTLAAMAALPGARPVCALSWDGPVLQAAAVFHLVRLDVGNLGHTAATAAWPVRAALAGLDLIGLGAPHLLLCGNVLHSDAPGFVHRGAEAPAALLADLAATVARTVPEAVHMVVCTAADLGADAAAMVDQGYHRVTTAQPTMRLALDPAWRGWDDYLGAMRSKYRQRARSARKKGQALERQVLTADEIIDHEAILDELLAPVLDRAEVVLAVPRAPVLAAMQRALGPDMVLRLYRLDGAPVAFSVGICDGTALDAMLVGLDDDRNRDHKLYQNILYDYVEDGIARGVRTVAMGRCALEIKSTVGATPHPMDVFVRHPRPLPHALFGLAVASLQAEDWTPRSPFK